MKNLFLKIILPVVMLGFFSCERSVDQPVTPIGGSWKINLYWDKKDETSNFSNWSFQFNNNGQLTATNGATVVNGQWLVNNSTKFQIDFGTHIPLSELNDNWLIEERTASSIKLKDDNPARDEKLQFVKF